MCDVVEASTDALDKTTLRITVQALAGDIYPNMERISHENSEPDMMGHNMSSSRCPSLLHPRRKIWFYQFSLGFESEQACSLAAEHIQSRRQYLRQDKLKFLKKSLHGWIGVDDLASSSKQ